MGSPQLPGWLCGPRLSGAQTSSHLGLCPPPVVALALPMKMELRPSQQHLQHSTHRAGGREKPHRSNLQGSSVQGGCELGSRVTVCPACQLTLSHSVLPWPPLAFPNWTAFLLDVKTWKTPSPKGVSKTKDVPSRNKASDLRP